MSVATLPPPGASAAQSATLASDEAIMRARARGAAWLAKWIHDGVLVDAGAAARAWNISTQAVNAARKRGELFSVWVDGKHWYVHEALKLERSKLARINRALGNADPSRKLLFFLRQHGALGGRVVSAAVADGDLDDILRLAAAWAHT